ncbi:DapH/DapD/GlmU-related protein [Candidatus Methylocalor cossyra]|uniref:Carbonic anhydrase/acetyltransferase-like protein (Isoleucine patch superfamily) n=1 Tax=Candidatus Methylocalor cossyra TaxID=3108543 RepID=A0ABP1C920_9GAMM
MKTHPLDYVFSLLAMGFLAGLAGLFVAFWVVPWSGRWLGSYGILADAALFLLAYGLFSGIFLRSLLALWPLRPGDYSMDDPHFSYWKFYTVLHEFGRGALLPFTTVFSKPVVSALFGARMGRNVAMGGHLVDPPLISVGRHAVLGLDSVIMAHAITSGRIILREVKVGEGSTVGVHAIIMPGVEIGPGAIVAAGSVVPMGTRIGPGELWAGIPARKIRDVRPDEIQG